ncbi:hypothetical protein jhhlp_005452 [Lomentospora prolificans]|uniref:Integral membrane protein n=1 Tax=Lomentospora prolificans TaxID=41688 RepID=A0A2N3N6X4_9PEZI|nr:hypothetical protein jhhlp_005452 [Lomentospora prolificans]
MDLASIYFGLFLGVFVFTFAKVLDQTQTIWRRTHSLVNAYVIMIWTETWVNFAFALITYLFLNGIIRGSVEFYTVSVILWAVQTQLLPQIIANRVGLIMVNRRQARYLKIGLFVLIAAVNIAVGFIWIPAMLPTVTPAQVSLNHAFEKAEKSFFLVIDLALNLYFLYLVRFRLIADGLTKYWTLFKFNVGIVLVSTSMDILLLGFLSLSDPYLYVQFAPTAYIIKLYIELIMATMISKVVRSGGSRHDYHASSSHKSNPTNYLTSRVVIGTGPAVPDRETNKSRRDKRLDDSPDRGSSAGSDIHLASYPSGQGILKTVETTVVVDAADDSRSDRT